MNENPGAYNEARNRLREEKERERRMLENIQEKFEKERYITRIEKKFDIFELKRRIETGRSLSVLQNDIQNALREGKISREVFDNLQEKIIISENKEKNNSEKTREDEIFALEELPFGQTDLAKFFENKKMWENFLVDIGGFFYGFFVQGSAIIVILAWKILLDILFLPRDIYNEIRK